MSVWAVLMLADMAMAVAGAQRLMVLVGVLAGVADMDMATAVVGAVIGLVLDITVFLLRLTTHHQWLMHLRWLLMSHHHNPWS
jgi:hypothetical protein